MLIKLEIMHENQSAVELKEGTLSCGNPTNIGQPAWWLCAIL